MIGQKDIYIKFGENDKRNDERMNKQNHWTKLDSTNMRISVLEDRTNSLEKMLRIYEERINIKEEERLNDIKRMESYDNIISKLNKKIKNLENQINNMITQKKEAEEENDKIIFDLTNRIFVLEEKLNQKNEKEKNDIICEENSNNNFDNFKELIKNHNEQIEKYIQEKIYNTNIDNENKINELLNLIQDINKIIEDNENKINIMSSNFNEFQKDNINIIEMVSVQDEKFKKLDFMVQEFQKLKTMINDINSTLEDKNEEEQFTKRYLS